VKARPLLLLLAIGGLANGCTAIKIAPLIPGVVAGTFRAKPIGLDMSYDYIEKGKFAQAEATLKELEGEPPRPLLTSEIAYIRALIAERQGHTADALARYRAVIAEFPHTPDAYLATKKVTQLTKSQG
jgi:hypothetical protein